MRKSRIVLDLARVCIAWIALYAGSAIAGDDWPGFRGPTGDGVSTATNLPVEFSDTQNVRWKVPVPGKAWSSPAVHSGRIWLTNAPEDGKQLSFVCVDLDSGKMVFDRVLFEQEKPAFCHPFNSHASSTVALEPGRAYIHFGSAGTGPRSGLGRTCRATTSGVRERPRSFTRTCSS
jgi:outer membrane protein assembly factor BamB